MKNLAGITQGRLSSFGKRYRYSLYTDPSRALRLGEVYVKFVYIVMCKFFELVGKNYSIKIETEEEIRIYGYAVMEIIFYAMRLLRNKKYLTK